MIVHIKRRLSTSLYIPVLDQYRLNIHVHILDQLFDLRLICLGMFRDLREVLVELIRQHLTAFVQVRHRRPDLWLGYRFIQLIAVYLFIVQAKLLKELSAIVSRD